MKKIFARTASFFGGHNLLLCTLTSVILTFLLEILGRRGIIPAIEYIGIHPIVFLYNVLIIFATLSVSMLFRRRIFVYTFVCSLWLTLGIVNCYLLSYRAAPLSVTDFKVFGAALGLIGIYMNPFQIILTIVAIALILFLLVFLFIRAPHHTGKLRHGFITVVCTSLSLIMTTCIGISAHTLEDDVMRDNLAAAYEKYGFAYCFSRSLLDRGIRRPNDYSQKSVDSLLQIIENDTEQLSETGAGADDGNNDLDDLFVKKPNIIFIQLESFVDTDNLDAVKTTENPTPYYDEMKQEYPSGVLTTPVMGAGTVYTEFEVLTGISVRIFGLGECPYYTVLADKACESIAYDLGKLGYRAHAIHNNTASFYDRNTVYPNLGFNTFTPVEYMYNVSENELGWAEDENLISSISDALDSTDVADFVYTVSVQCHGKYPSEYNAGKNDINAGLTDEYIKAEYPNISDYEKTSFENELTYYVNQLHDVDHFLRDLTDYLNQRGEPTVLVLFGDHMPDFGLAGDITSDAVTAYDTEYVIWNNIGLKAPDKNLKTYELSSYVCGLLDYSGGTMMNIHRTMGDDTDAMATIAYDMLYGEKYAETDSLYSEQSEYVPSKMTYGTREITITDAYVRDGLLYLTGSEFNKYSRVTINGMHRDTKYISENLVCAPYVFIGNNVEIELTQVTQSNQNLGSVKFEGEIYHTEQLIISNK